MRCFSGRRCAGLLIGVSVAAVAWGSGAQPASAQSTDLAASPAYPAATSKAAAENEKWWTTVATGTKHGHPGKSYFIEFRGRAAANYGHMYVLYGRVNARDEIVSSRIAGLHPAGDANDCYNCSLFNWTVGHLVPVPAETGASDGDLEEKYVTARYRVWLTEAQFKDVDAYIRKLQADNPLWNALFNNCVGFGRTIAVHMGLKVPAMLWEEPKDFVEGLRKENGLEAEQLPLKDAGASRATHASAKKVAHASTKTMPLPPRKPNVEPASAAQPSAKTTPAIKPKKPVANAPQAEHQTTLSARFGREQVMTTSAAQ